MTCTLAGDFTAVVPAGIAFTGKSFCLCLDMFDMYVLRCSSMLCRRMACTLTGNLARMIPRFVPFAGKSLRLRGYIFIVARLHLLCDTRLHGWLGLRRNLRLLCRTCRRYRICLFYDTWPLRHTRLLYAVRPLRLLGVCLLL